MIILTTGDVINVDLLQAVTSGDLPCYGSWRDVTTSTYTPGRSFTTTSGTLARTFISTPDVSTQRVVDYMNIVNTDATAKTLFVSYNSAGTDYYLWSGNLDSGDRLEYTDGRGFATFMSNGSIKNVTVQGNATSNQLNTVILQSDITNTGINVMIDVTGLQFNVLANNRYYFYFYIPYHATVTTNGSRWSINGPASPTFLNYISTYTLTATSQTLNYASGYDLPAASNATSLVAGNVASIEGEITPSTNGTIVARFAGETGVGASIIAKSGAMCQWMRIG